MMRVQTKAAEQINRSTDQQRVHSREVCRPMKVGAARAGAAKPSAEIVYRQTGRGLVEDAALLTALLERAGYTVRMTVLPTPGRWWLKSRYWLDALVTRLPVLVRLIVWLSSLTHHRVVASAPDLSIHLQSPVISYLGKARQTWLVPNQEWFRSEWAAYLPLYDSVKCKTRASEQVFSQFHQNTELLGFSGCYVTDVVPWLPMKRDAPAFFLHVAGRSLRKGTDELIDLWRGHPSWPALRVVTDYPDRFGRLPENVTVFSDVPSATVAGWRQHAIAVLAPSHVEGFGHSILEPLALGGLVITTDAPPMNELVDRSRGVLVAATRAERVLLGQAYRVKTDALEAAVCRAIAMSADEQAALRKAAMRWAQENHAKFLERWTSAVETVEGVADINS